MYLPVVWAVILYSAALTAQTPNQVIREVNSAQVKALANHLPKWANASNDAGSAPPDQNLDQMTLVLSRSEQQQQVFESFLAAQQDPASPEYHHWLTPSEVGDRFGLSPQDIASVTAWLESQGLHINWISPSRIFIGFGGTAGDIGRALQTQLHTYNVNGAKRLSVSSDPTIPEALAPAIKAIRGLYTIEEHPLHSATAMSSDSPLLTGSTGSHFIAPGDFATIYDVPPGASGYGQSIGIVGRARTNFADFANFRNRTVSYFPNPTEIVPTAFGGVDPGPAYTAPPTDGGDAGEQSEATLDVTRAGSIAPNANLLLVVASVDSGGIEADAQYLVQTSPVPVQVMTISYGACESAAGPSGVDFWDALFQQAAAEGISSFVSSGDSGASGCDPAFQAPPANPVPNSPNYLCSSSYVTCVGGTQFNDTSNPSAYWNSGNGFGLSSVLGYIPEGAWNEPLDRNSAPQPASTGGGVSSVIPTPSWQTGTGVPSARSGRYTPDVSFSASEHDGYFACFAASGGSCATGTDGSYHFVAFAGTSASAPSMAGVAALLNQSKGESQGNLNLEIYKLAAKTPAAFHDVTVATSGVSNCSVNTPSICNNSVPSATRLSGGQAGYAVTAGYDEATGLGSLDVQTFLNSYAAKLVPTVTVTPSATSITIQQGLTVSVTVDGGAGNPTPTGSVQLTDGNYNSAVVTLINGAATFNIAAGSLPSGYIGLQVKYTPDAASSSIYAISSGTTYVSVSLLTPTVTVTPSSTSITTAQSLTVTVTVNGGNGSPVPIGTVNLAGGGYSSQASLKSGNATFTIYPGMLTAGSDVLQANYIPDARDYSTYYSSSNSTTVTVTATAPITPTVTVTSAYLLVAKAGTLPVAIVVSGGSGNPIPTGKVILISGAYSSPTTALANSAATITIPPQSLAVGNNSLTAVYAPDSTSASIYNNAAGYSWVSVLDPVKSVPAITITPSTTSINPTQALSVWIAVAGTNGYPTTTGTVVLSGGGFTSAPATLNVNSATIVIPAGSLAMGANVLTVTYTPDAESAPVFYSASNTTTVTVGLPSFTIGGDGTPPVSLLAGQSFFSTIIVVPTAGFTGAVALSATVSSSPNGGQYPPSLSFGSTSTVNIDSVSGQTATMTITTTAPTSADLVKPKRPGVPWYAAGGATLVCILLFGIPARRRSWRTVLGMTALFVALAGGVLSCGGGGVGMSGGGGGGGGNSGTTAGTYTITVTGTSGTITATGTVTLNVQ